MLINELFGIGYKTPGLDSDKFVAGVECELEAIKAPCDLPGWMNIEDGSLRNNGREYVSVPMNAAELVRAFRMLHNHLKYDKDAAFSPRTSTHVHVNCLPLDERQVKQLVLLYALFEECFFSMVKPDRRGNIHCVPLTETHMPQLYSHGIEKMSSLWHKYTAINLKRLRDIGTVEFRHLHGTGNAEEFETWLKVLEKLWLLSREEPMTGLTLRSNVQVLQWFDYIFEPAPAILQLRPSIQHIIKNSLIDVKMAFI